MIERPEPSVEAQKRVPVRKKAEMKFLTSRSRATQTKIVKRYAEWYAINKLGYTPQQFKMVDKIWEQESHWNWDAVNETTGAHGIWQKNGGSRIKNPFRQVETGFKYIAHRYGTPEAAYKHKKEYGTY